MFSLDLTSAGERLASGLCDAGQGEAAGEVTRKVEDLRETHRTLLEDITDQETLLDAALTEQENMTGETV